MANYTIWKFKTAQFTVTLSAEEEFDLDLSFDETGETAEKIESGEWVAFCAVVTVTHKGHVLGSDALGQCIYSDASEFATSHRDPDPMNRNCSIMRAARGGNVCICHYFPEMVSAAISEARVLLREMRSIPVRLAA